VGGHQDLQISTDTRLCCSDEDKQTHLSEGFPKGLEKEFTQQKDQRILVRQQSLELFESVKNLVEDRSECQTPPCPTSIVRKSGATLCGAQNNHGYYG
jgi:hypothetical protein